jgi:hypothetical protein
MYHSGKDTLSKVSRSASDMSIPKSIKQRRLHKAFLRYHDSKNWPLLREALKNMGRANLIGNGKQHLVPNWQLKEGGKDDKIINKGKSFRTQRTENSPTDNSLISDLCSACRSTCVKRYSYYDIKSNSGVFSERNKHNKSLVMKWNQYTLFKTHYSCLSKSLC